MRTTKPIKELIEDFLSERSTAPSSIINYRQTLKLFVHWQVTTSRDVRNITRSDIIAYRQSLIDAGKSSLTIDNYMASLKLFFAWLEEKDYHSNVTLGLKTIKKVRKYRKSFLSNEQMVQLIRSMQSLTGIVAKRDYAIIWLMLTTGLRCVEITRANIADLDDETLVVQRKGQVEKREILGVPTKTLEAIREYLSMREFSDGFSNIPLFVNHSNHGTGNRLSPELISLLVKRRLKDAGITGHAFSAHSLRHTFASHALKNGESIYTVKAMLGHKSVATTEMYTGLIDDQLRIDNAPGKNFASYMSENFPELREKDEKNKTSENRINSE